MTASTKVITIVQIVSSQVGSAVYPMKLALDMSSALMTTPRLLFSSSILLAQTSKLAKKKQSFQIHILPSDDE